MPEAYILTENRIVDRGGSLTIEYTFSATAEALPFVGPIIELPVISYDSPMFNSNGYGYLNVTAKTSGTVVYNFYMQLYVSNDGINFVPADPAPTICSHSYPSIGQSLYCLGYKFARIYITAEEGVSSNEGVTHEVCINFPK